MVAYKIFKNGTAEVREPTIDKIYTAYGDKYSCSCLYIGNGFFKDDMEGWHTSMKGFPFLVEHP